MFKPVAIAAGFSFSTAYHPAGGRDDRVKCGLYKA